MILPVGTPLSQTLNSTMTGLLPASEKYKSTEDTNTPPGESTVNVCARGSWPPLPPPPPPPPPPLFGGGKLLINLVPRDDLLIDLCSNTLSCANSILRELTTVASFSNVKPVAP